MGRLELPASCSQTCVGTFRRHSAALFGPFLCSGSLSLTLFGPACFKQNFLLLGWVWDWILYIKRCSARFEEQWRAGSPQWRGAGIAPHKQRIQVEPALTRKVLSLLFLLYYSADSVPLRDLKLQMFSKKHTISSTAVTKINKKYNSLAFWLYRWRI